MKKFVVLLASVAIMATLFLTGCQDYDFTPPSSDTGLYIHTFLRDYPTIEKVELITSEELNIKSAMFADTTEYLFEITSFGARILNDNSMTVLDFKVSGKQADFTLSDGSMVTAYLFPAGNYGVSNDFPFNGIIRARNFILSINGENNVKMWDLETGNMMFSGSGMCLGENNLSLKMGIFIPSLEFVGVNPNGIGNIFEFNWLTESYPGYSLTKHQP